MALIFSKIRNAHSRKFLSTGAMGQYDQPIFQESNNHAFNKQWLLMANQDNSIFSFVNRNSGWVVDAIGGVSPGTHLQQFPDHQGTNQRWKLEDVDRNAQTFIIHAVGTDLVWTVDSASTVSGALVQLSQRTGGDEQIWSLSPDYQAVVDNTVKIRCRASGLVLDVQDGADVEGIIVQQYTDDNGLNQTWTIEDAGNGFVKIRVVYSGKILDVAGQLQNVATVVTTYSDNGGMNQLWQIVDRGNGFMRIIPAVNPGFSLDIPFGSGDPGVVLQQYPENGGLNQQWELIPV